MIGEEAGEEIPMENILDLRQNGFLVNFLFINVLDRNGQVLCFQTKGILFYSDYVALILHTMIGLKDASSLLNNFKINNQ